MTEEQDQSNQAKQPSNKARLSHEAMEQAISPHKSYWPFGLAIALAVMALGVVTYPLILGIGVVLAAIAVIGWGLEHR